MSLPIHPCGVLQTCTAGVLDIAFHSAGAPDGPPVLLMHGFPYDVHAYAEVVPLLQLDLDSPERAAAQLVALSSIGVTGVNHTARYDNEAEFRVAAAALVEARARAGLA